MDDVFVKLQALLAPFGITRYLALQNCSCDRTSFGSRGAPGISLFTFGPGSLPWKWPV